MGSKPSTRQKETPTTIKSTQPKTQSTGTEKSENTFSPHEVPENPDKSDLKRQESVSNRDLMISYSHQDKEMMAKLRENLEINGISVWVDVVGLGAGVDFLSKIGQAILDAKLFVSLLSTSTVKSKYCQDEVALAYISKKAMFPVAIQPKEEIYAIMDTGMKLQLASLEWTSLDPDNFDEGFQELLSKLKTELEDQEKEAKLGHKVTERLKERQKRFQRQKSIYIDPHLSENPTVYWNKFYKDKDSVELNQFAEDFQKYYKDDLNKVYPLEDQTWLINNLKEEISMSVDTEMEIITPESLTEFCTVDGEVQALWERVTSYAQDMYAMKDVFAMDSTVRVDAIENLGKYQSASVIESLRDLLRNQDSNIRAVAAVSLAKTGNQDKSTINVLLKCLKDKDRLVREAGCLALGHMKAKAAVPKLLHLWRNDFISHVREAAQAALLQIGGEKVDKAMHITKVLAEEIRLLTEEN
ncbi:uncharacterized protein LOC133205368 [Saccostrea echinata]|uniref:uncharacterized protein LOC133205368 n=1 Tax=Saccostrea echinata TaxID=191078 RepID=UPI002A80A9D5|nr:uncharacterized protein LOC133205368 [Saccostrea echinata]